MKNQDAKLIPRHVFRPAGTLFEELFDTEGISWAFRNVNEKVGDPGCKEKITF
jgi:hypothetical protein